MSRIHEALKKAEQERAAVQSSRPTFDAGAYRRSLVPTRRLSPRSEVSHHLARSLVLHRLDFCDSKTCASTARIRSGT